MPEHENANTRTKRTIAAAVAANVTRRMTAKEIEMPKTKKTTMSVAGKSRTNGTVQVPETNMPELTADLTPAAPVAVPDAWSEAALEQARKGGDAIAEFLGEDNPFAKMMADELLDAAEALDPKARAVERVKTRKNLLRAAAAAKLDPAMRSTLLRIIAKRTDATAKALEDEFELVTGEFNRIGAPSADQLAARRAEEEARLAAERAAEAAELEADVMPLATDPMLFDKLVQFAHDCGVVDETAGVLAVMLVVMSRHNRRKAMSLLRRGAPASGKNFVVEVILAMLEEGQDYVTFSDGSPKSMGYYGGVEETDAFRNKVIYLPEAAAIASKHGIEDDKAHCLRVLISEGRFQYPTVMKDDDGALKSVILAKNGPIAVLTTSARDNVEPELLTRVLISDADESTAQTALVVEETIRRSARGSGRKGASGTDLDQWRKYHRWMRLGGPYDVHVPQDLALAFAAGYAEVLRSVGVPLRVRRDVTSLLMAVAASAIAHKAQRSVTEEGEIVAEIGDYALAYRAFAGGLTALYRPAGSLGVIRLVEGLERLIAAEASKAIQAQMDKAAKAGMTMDAWRASHPFEATGPDTVKASYKKIAKELGINTTSTVSARIADAVAEGVIEIVESGHRGYGASGTYRVVVSSKELRSPSRAVPVIPTPERMMELMSDPKSAAAISDAAITEALLAKASGTSAAHPDAGGAEEDAEAV